jgi:hypothetical protein
MYDSLKFAIVGERSPRDVSAATGEIVSIGMVK